ncbi:hypothetical protein ACFVAD_17675 [Sutcliffiella sp. NPDC057660]|uniref:hypothetical protein n=1 Tax=Sutcliffiella sp. NPDC057660 TaxID=3346199 RepID=UPI0036AE487B
MVSAMLFETTILCFWTNGDLKHGFCYHHSLFLGEWWPQILLLLPPFFVSGGMAVSNMAFVTTITYFWTNGGLKHGFCYRHYLLLDKWRSQTWLLLPPFFVSGRMAVSNMAFVTTILCFWTNGGLKYCFCYRHSLFLGEWRSQTWLLLPPFFVSGGMEASNIAFVTTILCFWGNGGLKYGFCYRHYLLLDEWRSQTWLLLPPLLTFGRMAVSNMPFVTAITYFWTNGGLKYCFCYRHYLLLDEWRSQTWLLLPPLLTFGRMAVSNIAFDTTIPFFRTNGGLNLLFPLHNLRKTCHPVSPSPENKKENKVYLLPHSLSIFILA